MKINHDDDMSQLRHATSHGHMRLVYDCYTRSLYVMLQILKRM